MYASLLHKTFQKIVETLLASWAILEFISVHFSFNRKCLHLSINIKICIYCIHMQYISHGVAFQYTQLCSIYNLIIQANQSSKNKYKLIHYFTSSGNTVPFFILHINKSPNLSHSVHS